MNYSKPTTTTLKVKSSPVIVLVIFAAFGCLSTRSYAAKCPPTTPESTMVEIATYEEVKDLPNHPEKVLIDVREPNELAETGQIPTSINIPRKEYGARP